MTVMQHMPSLLVICNNDSKSNEIQQIVYEIGKEFRSEIFTIFDRNTTELSSRVLEYYSIKNLPAIVGLLMDKTTGEFYRYKYEYNTITYSQILTWVNELLNNKLEKYYQSEEMPENPIIDNVHIVVGNTFHEIILNDNKDVLLYIHAPWCKYCISFDARYSRLASKLKENKNLILAKMDGSMNEYEGIKLEALPTLLFF